MSSPKDTKSLTARIAAISKELGAIAKSGHNKEQGYDFIEYAEVSGKMRELFDKHGIAIYPHVEQIIQADTVESKYGKTGYHLIIQMRFLIINADDTSDQIERSWMGEATDYGDKAINKAETSGVKYFYMRLFNISEKGDKDNDPDGQDNSSKAKGEPAKTYAKNNIDFQALRDECAIIDDVESLKELYERVKKDGISPAQEKYVNEIINKRKKELEH